jgi:uncharacterized protein (UPF0332 family)
LLRSVYVLVKTGILPIALGRMFNRLHEIRLIGDYGGEPVELDIAKSALHDATEFVDAIKLKFFNDDLGSGAGTRD